MKLNEVSSSIGATGGPLHKIQSNLSDAIQDLKSAIHTNPELKRGAPLDPYSFRIGQ